MNWIREFCCSEDQRAFNEACAYGQLDKIQQMHPKLIQAIAFINACDNGHLDVVRQLYEWNSSFVENNIETFFPRACASGNVELVRQLREWKPDLNISWDDEIAFRWACTNGHLVVAQQLHEWKPDLDICAQIVPKIIMPFDGLVPKVIWMLCDNCTNGNPT